MVSIFDFGEDTVFQGMDEDQRRQAISQGLLDFGSQMLGASSARGQAPSFGQGLAAGAQGLSQSLQNTREQQMMDMKRQQMQQEIEQRRRQQELQQGLIGQMDPEKAQIFQAYPELGKEAIKRQYLPEAANPTSAQRNAQFLFPDDPDAQRRYVQQTTGPRPAPSLSVSLPPQESAYAKERGQAYAKTANEIMADARNADAQISQINALRNIMSDPSVYTGTGGGAIANLKRFGSTMLGMELEGVGGAEAAEAIGNRMVIDMASDVPGQLSDRDMAVLRSIPPSLSRSAEGNELIADYFERVNRRKLKEAELASQYEQQQGQIDAGFYQQMSEYNRENPLFTETDVKRMQRAAEQVPQSAPGAGAEPEIDALMKKYGVD